MKEDTGYQHDGHADNGFINATYLHDGRADKRRYRHDRNVRCNVEKNHDLFCIYCAIFFKFVVSMSFS